MNIANKVTTLRMIMVPIFVVLYYVFGQEYNIAAIVFAVAALTDAVDGHLARSRNLVTTFGKFADPLVDKLLTMAAFVVLTGTGVIPSWAVIIVIARELIITGFRTIAASNNITIAASKGGKLKTLSQCFAIVFLLVNNLTLNKIGIVIFYIAVVLTIYSGWDYLVKNKNVLNLDNI
ncbi:MAG: CDP-diacylglycerol--glycerol-3-phosphate 3-phosphatidyltransferase [Anaerococcus sp.]